MASSVVRTSHLIGSIRTETFSVTADAITGSVPSVALPAIEGKLLHLQTSPGVPAPTSGYSVSLVDESGHDVLETVGQALSAVNVQKTPILFAGTSIPQIVDESNTLTLAIRDNVVPSARMTIVLAYALGA